MDKPAKKDLTLKQRKWIKEYIKTGNATEAAMRVYDCKDRDSANALGNENLAKLSMPELMEDLGLTDVALMNIGAEGMTKANKIHGTNDNFVEIPDYGVRHKYWETMLKLKKRLGAENQTNIQVNIQPILGELKAE